MRELWGRLRAAWDNLSPRERMLLTAVGVLFAGVLVSVAVVNPIKSHTWLLFWPSLFLAMTLFSLNFMGDGLRDALDPRTRH